MKLKLLVLLFVCTNVYPVGQVELVNLSSKWLRVEYTGLIRPTSDCITKCGVDGFRTLMPGETLNVLGDCGSYETVDAKDIRVSVITSQKPFITLDIIGGCFHRYEITNAMGGRVRFFHESKAE